MKEYMVKHVGKPAGSHEWRDDASILSEFIQDYLNTFTEDGWRVHSWNILPNCYGFYVFLFEREKPTLPIPDLRPAAVLSLHSAEDVEK